MIFIYKDTSINKEYLDSCRDAVGDEDNCCEYGWDMESTLRPLTIKDIFDIDIEE